MAETRLEGREILPNITVLMSLLLFIYLFIIFIAGGNKKFLIHKEKSHFPCTVRKETTKFKAGTLPLNMYDTAVHGGERLDFAQNEDSEAPQDDEGKHGSSSGIPEAD